MNDRNSPFELGAGLLVGIILTAVLTGIFLVPHWRETHSQELVDQGLLEWRVDRVTGETYLANPHDDPLEPPPIPEAGN